MAITWQQAVLKLYDLHLMRMGMSYHSIYHGVYEEKCIELNAVIVAQTGRNYVSLSRKEIEDAIVEATLLLATEVKS